MEIVRFIYIVFLLLIECNGIQDCFQDKIEVFLLRKKRSLSFPDGSTIAVKRSFSKAIIGNIPRGLNINIDCGIYFPLPDTSEPWNPLKLVYRLNVANLNVLPNLQNKAFRISGQQFNLKNVHSKTYVVPNINKWSSKDSRWFQENNLKQLKIKNINKMRAKIDNMVSHNLKRRHNIDTARNSSTLPISLESCVTKALCKINNSIISSGHSFIFDVSQILFNPSGNLGLDCSKRFFAGCPQSTVEFLMRYIKLSNIN